MVKVKDIVEIIEKAAPLSLAYEWDNSGFICGNPEKEVKKVFLTLDMFKSNIDEAVELGVDMIVSHHPILFSGIKKIDFCSQQGYIVKKLIENDIALYSAHTSMDCAAGGINDVLAQKLGIKGTRVIEKNEKCDGCGLGRIGKLEKEMSVGEFAQVVKDALSAPFVRVAGDFDKKIKTVAVGGGACDDLIPAAIEMGADIFVTADMKHHITADSIDCGIAVIDAGHFATEVFVKDIFEKLLEGTDVEIFKSNERDVFNIV